MSRRTFTVIASAMLLIGAAVRVHNARTFPVLASYDAFGHFTYIWYLSETWRVPLPTSGWEFFHPPLYYALMAALWTGLAGLDPVARLRVGMTVVAAASLIHVAAVWDIVRRRVPGDLLLQLLAGGFMLFLPVHLYSAAFLGNEGLTAVLCTLALLVLLAQLRRPTWTRSALLGVVLGLAMLTKISALAIVVGALGTIALKALHERRLRRESVRLAVVVTLMLTTCGWYYARNVERYGTPFVMSRTELMLRMAENIQPQARRSLGEYVLFDPMIFRRPAWPRIVPGETADSWSRARRDSVWTGLYANTWFDGFGGWVVPLVTDSELARRAGQALLVLGIVPTLLVFVGIGHAIWKLRRDGWDDVLVACLLTLGTMLVIFIVGTRTVPIPAAVKATYLMPVTVTFGVCFALGLEHARKWRPTLVPMVAANLLMLSAVAVVVFWQGLLFDPLPIRGAEQPMANAIEQNLYGVVYYAAGNRDAARQRFAVAAARGWHLGYENLGLLALDEGNPTQALHLLKRAMRLQPEQSFGRPADRTQFDRITGAEYLNLVAVVSHALGRPDRAERAAAGALRLDPTIPEVHYDLAVATLERALGGAERTVRGGALSVARVHLDRALALDPGFGEARELLAATRALEHGCDPGIRDAEPLEVRQTSARLYPIETGTGATQSASISRRRHITPVPGLLRAEAWRGRCDS